MLTTRTAQLGGERGSGRICAPTWDCCQTLVECNRTCGALHSRAAHGAAKRFADREWLGASDTAAIRVDGRNHQQQGKRKLRDGLHGYGTEAIEERPGNVPTPRAHIGITVARGCRGCEPVRNAAAEWLGGNTVSTSILGGTYTY